MKIKYKILLIVCFLTLISSFSFFIVHYNVQKKTLLDGIDSKLLTAAHFTRSVLPDDFHDKIIDKNSISKDAYLNIVDRNNKLCLKLGLQYVWSVMLINDQTVFTTGTSTSKKVEKGDHASFFDIHTNPQAYAAAFQTMQTQYSSFHDKWGDGRMVLVPAVDNQGRKFIFGASMSINDVSVKLKETVQNSAVIGLCLLLVGFAMSFIIANSLSRPLERISNAAKDISKGQLDQRLEIKGSLELESLANSINTMSGSIKDQMEEIEQRNRDLESKNEELERFTYTVSHDLKSPLITIKGFLGMLEKDAVEGNIDRMKSDINRISQAADKMQLLLEELLELSRIGRIVNPSTTIQFKDLAQKALDTIAGRLYEKNITIELDASPVEIKGDISRLLEVMENLVDNAAKFSREEEPAIIMIGTRQEAGETIYFVKDNGIGIKPQYQEKIFGLFDKLDQKAEGTGIGLAIAKRVIGVHGGRIWVESEGEDKGTTFCFTVAESTETNT